MIAQLITQTETTPTRHQPDDTITTLMEQTDPSESYGSQLPVIWKVLPNTTTLPQLANVKVKVKAKAITQ